MAIALADAHVAGEDCDRPAANLHIRHDGSLDCEADLHTPATAHGVTLLADEGNSLARGRHLAPFEQVYPERAVGGPRDGILVDTDARCKEARVDRGLTIDCLRGKDAEAAQVPVGEE